MPFLNSNLNWKQHIQELTKIISRSIGVLCKLRHFVPSKKLINTDLLLDYFFHSLPMVYSDMGKYLSNESISISHNQNIINRILSFSHFQAHTSKLFKKGHGHNQTLHCNISVSISQRPYSKKHQRFLHVSM